jgi:hypothetical protein
MNANVAFASIINSNSGSASASNSKSSASPTAALKVVLRSLAWAALLAFLAVSPAVIVCSSVRGYVDGLRAQGFVEESAFIERSTGFFTPSSWLFDMFCVQNWLGLPRPTPPEKVWEEWVPSVVPASSPTSTSGSAGGLSLSGDIVGARCVNPWARWFWYHENRYYEFSTTVTVTLSLAAANVRVLDWGNIVMDGRYLFLDIKPERDAIQRAVFTPTATHTYSIGWLKQTYFWSYSEYEKYAQNRSALRNDNYAEYQRYDFLPDYYVLVVRAWGREVGSVKVFFCPSYERGYGVKFGPWEPANATVPADVLAGVSGPPRYVMYDPPTSEILLDGYLNRVYNWSGPFKYYLNLTLALWSPYNIRVQWSEMTVTWNGSSATFCVDLRPEREVGSSEVTNTYVNHTYYLGEAKLTRYLSYSNYLKSDAWFKDSSYPDYHTLIVKVWGREVGRVKVFINICDVHKGVNFGPWE